MSSIPPLFKDNKEGALPATTQPSTIHKSKWLYELERAQWNRKQQLPTSAGKDPHGKNETEFHGPSSASLKRRTVDGTDTTTQTYHPKSGFSEPSRPIAPSPSGFVARNNTPVERSVPIVLASLFPPVPANPTEARATQPAALSRSASALAKDWDKQHAHVESKDGETQLWLRDTRISVAQGVELAATLRKRFAELGVKLARFTLNGHSYDLSKPPKPAI